MVKKIFIIILDIAQKLEGNIKRILIKKIVTIILNLAFFFNAYLYYSLIVRIMEDFYQ